MLAHEFFAPAAFCASECIAVTITIPSTYSTDIFKAARLTSTLILMFLYIGFISLQSSIDDVRRADRAGAVLAIVGVINVPIIYFSVQWWNSLHQGATITARSFKMAPSMRSAMLIMVGACWLYSIAVVLVRVRHIIREREQEAPWLAESPA